MLRLSITEIVLTTFVLFFSYRWSRRTRLTIPRLGPPTVFGYVWTAIRFTFQLKELLKEGRERFGGRPYELPSLSGSWVVLSGDDVEFLRTADDSTFSQPHAVVELLTTRQTMDNDMFIGNNYHANVVRTDLTRSLPLILPELIDETQLALREVLEPIQGSDSVALPVWNTMTHLIARISNRALVGTELCRNKEYTSAIVRFAEFVVIYSYMLRVCPMFMRGPLYFLLSSIFGGKKQPLAILTEQLKKHIKDRESMAVKPVLVTEFLVKAAPPQELVNPSLMGMRLLNLNFGSVHTSTIFITHTLFDLALMSEDQREEIRAEILESLDKFGGWTKDALAGFSKLDSIMREVGRFRVGAFGIFRRTIKEGCLPDGQIIPPGYTCIANMDTVHRDPKIYPDPEVFDPFRFSKLRDQITDGSGGGKYLFTGVGKDFLPFGGGRHVCAGRFFVAMELKVILAQILLNYDFQFPDGATTRPVNMYFDIGVAPNTKAKLIFKKRSQQY